MMVGVAWVSGRFWSPGWIRQSGVISSRLVVELSRDTPAGALYRVLRKHTPWGGTTYAVSAYGDQVKEINMIQQLKTRLDRSFKLTQDLVLHLDEIYLGLDLPSLPSNRIAGQLWCIVGARESYTRSIETGGWKRFSCSLTTPRVKQSVLITLEATHKRMNDIDFADLTDTQVELAFDLLEHEVQHHGQLIRFVYGNGLTFPDSWNKRYTV